VFSPFALSNGGIVGFRFAVGEVEQTSKELFWNQAAEQVILRFSDIMPDPG
jgi:hypothetical protein